mmetsp:Transcript_2388/g.2768  ORF Transcript_2388/g.2768 Transcript_2388/m.2768 type:complete len:97 (-) Transcript_2388:915-1205(-)
MLAYQKFANYVSFMSSVCAKIVMLLFIGQFGPFCPFSRILLVAIDYLRALTNSRSRATNIMAQDFDLSYVTWLTNDDEFSLFGHVTNCSTSNHFSE